MTLLTEDPWAPAVPEDALRWFRGTSFRWWLAGGWAIDRVTGTSRPHADLDLAVLRAELPTVVRELSEWQLFEASRGELRLLSSQELPRPDVHGLWCRRPGERVWMFELLIEESTVEASGEVTWLFRRDPRVRRALGSIVLRGACGLPIVAPEVQLLYKSKDPREKDERDFARALPQLSTTARTWLRENLDRVQPGHAWAAELARGASGGVGR